MSHFVFVVGLSALLQSLCPALSQAAPVRVVMSGDAAPTGGVFSAFTVAKINPAGQVTFQANVTGGPVTFEAFYGTGGVIGTLAARNSAAPAGGNFDRVVFPTLNTVGDVAFYADLAGGSADGGIFQRTPGGFQTVALLGAAAPAGGLYNELDTSQPVQNDSGAVAFRAGLRGGSAGGGIFAGPPGAVAAVALVGTVATANGKYGSFSGPRINAGGQVAFSSYLQNTSGGFIGTGLFVGRPGAVRAVAATGGVTPVGGTFGGDMTSSPPVNAAGQIAFNATIINGPSPQGVFVGTADDLRPLALRDTAAPGGGTFIGFDDPQLNDRGQVGFRGHMTNSVAGQSGDAIFVGTPGDLRAVARRYALAPTGGTYGSLTVGPFNNAGQIAFTTNLSGDGFTSANNFTLFVASPDGVSRVIAGGDIIDVDPGVGVDLRTVTSNGIVIDSGVNSGGGLGSGLTDDGVLAYRLRFTDGTSGLFTSVVPEPATLGLLAVIGAGLLRRR